MPNTQVGGVAQPNVQIDPDLLAIMLGMGAQVVAGTHPQSWQAQLGKGAMGLAQSFKMAKALERRRGEERDFWKRLFGTLGGGGEEAALEEPLMTMAPRQPSGFMHAMRGPSKPPVTGFPTYKNPMTTMLGG